GQSSKSRWLRLLYAGEAKRSPNACFGFEPGEMVYTLRQGAQRLFGYGVGEGLPESDQRVEVSGFFGLRPANLRPIFGDVGLILFWIGWMVQRARDFGWGHKETVGRRVRILG